MRLLLVSNWTKSSDPVRVASEVSLRSYRQTMNRHWWLFGWAVHQHQWLGAGPLKTQSAMKLVFLMTIKLIRHTSETTGGWNIRTFLRDFMSFFVVFQWENHIGSTASARIIPQAPQLPSDRKVSPEQWKKGPWLFRGFVGDEIRIPSYVRIITSHFFGSRH